MRKLWKRSAALVLAGLMAVSLAACGGGNSGSAGSAGSSAGSGNSGGAAASNTGGSSNSGEIVKLVVWALNNAETEDAAEVAEAVSAITREKIGAEIQLVNAQDAEQIQLALTSGEPIDLLNYNNLNGQLTAILRNNYAYPLDGDDDLIHNYGQGALSVIAPADLEACRYNGTLYALPNQKDTSRSAGFAMRKDIVDELGIEVPEYGTFDDMHDILVKVHEAHPEMYPVVSTWAGGGFQQPWPMDPLGDNLGVLPNVFDDSTTVENWYATDTYREFCEMMYQWNQEGLIMPDITTSTENGLFGGNGFSMFENWKPGKEYEVYKSQGKECVFMKVVQPHKYTSLPNGNSWIIPYCSPHPDKAMQFWDLMYTDADIANLLVNGIEGKHWVWADDAHTCITTPEGVDPNTSGYPSVDWSWPNQQLTPVWEGVDPDLWDKLNEFNESGHVSPAHGFFWNSDEVMNQVTNCNNVVSQYNNSLIWGTVDPDATIPQFLADLEAAGINDIIAAKQKQLDEFLANKTE